jgi:hypothetical protein
VFDSEKHLEFPVKFRGEVRSPRPRHCHP